MSDETRPSASEERDARVTEVARILRERFSQAEREALVRDLGANPEDVKLKPETRDDFTWALIDYFERRGQLGALCVAAARAVDQRGPSRAHGDAMGHARAASGSAALFALTKRVARSRAGRLGVGSLLAAGVVLTALGPLRGCLLHEVSPTTTSRILVALEAQSSPEAALAHRALCDKLKALGGARVSCIDLEEYGGEFRAKADEIGASLAVAVEKDATARLVPLGRLTRDELLAGGVRPIDLSLDGAGDRLPRVLYQLSIIADSSFETKDIVCVSLPEASASPGSQGNLDAISLLAVYARQFAPWCIADENECALLHRVASCNPRAPDRWLSCEFAMHLLTERCPRSESAVSALKTLTETASSLLYRDVAMLKLARRYCGEGATVEERKAALRMLRELASRGKPCMTAALSEVAVCLVLASAADELTDLDHDYLQKIAEPSPEELDVCVDRSVAARAVAGRAFCRAVAGEWNAAADDYAAAYKLYPVHEYLLSQAESLLHQGTADAMRKADDLLKRPDARVQLGGVPGAPNLYIARASIRRAVLSWIAGNKRGLSKEDRSDRWEEVIREYSALHETDVAVEADEGLAELLREILFGECVFKRLSERYHGSTTGNVAASPEAMRRCVTD